MKLLTKTLLAAAATAVTALAPLTASAALTWTYNWAGADTFEGGSPDGRPLSFATDKAKFTAESLVRFNGAPFTAGTTFTDYIVLRFDQFFIGNLANGEPLYGGPNGNREITLVTTLTGTQTSNSTYAVNPGGTVRFYYDSRGAGRAFPYTAADFTNLSTFNDGSLIETGTVVAGSGLNSSSVPDGTIDVTVALNDTIVPGGFERDVNGAPLLNLTLALFNSNNALCSDQGGTETCGSTTGSIRTFFGAGTPTGSQQDFHTQSDGSMTKANLPEPASLALLGVALLGLSATRRRKS